MFSVMPDQLGAPMFVAGLYWQQSKWDGSKTVPVILEVFDSGAVRLGVADAIIFAVRAPELTYKFTFINQLVLSVGDTKYTLYGLGTTRSPQFAPVMVDYLQRMGAQAATRHGENGINEFLFDTLKVINPGIYHGGKRASAAMAADGEVAKLAMEPWRELLPRVGARPA